jgi:hypothetical protein
MDTTGTAEEGLETGMSQALEVGFFTLIYIFITILMTI